MTLYCGNFGHSGVHFVTIESVISRTTQPATVTSLRTDLQKLGMHAGDTVLVHCSLSQLGYIAGGPQTVINALLDVLGVDGTLMMPTHTGNNTDPANWKHPAVPAPWWDIIRDNTPAFDPQCTPSRGMGIMAELFRRYAGVTRSEHPIGSFAACGKHAEFLLHDHTCMREMFGDNSPVGRLYDLDGHVLLLGLSHHNNTSLHLAEYRATYPNKRYIKEGTAVTRNGRRQWVNFEMLGIDNDDFEVLGTDYAATCPAPADLTSGIVGAGKSIYLRQRPLVDFAVTWFDTNRR